MQLFLAENRLECWSGPFQMQVTTSTSPWMDIAFQLATAAKHFNVSEVTGPEVVTSIDFQFEPGAMAHDLSGREEIMVATHGNTISGPDDALAAPATLGKIKK